MVYDYYSEQVESQVTRHIYCLIHEDLRCVVQLVHQKIGNCAYHIEICYCKNSKFFAMLHILISIHAIKRICSFVGSNYETNRVMAFVWS